MDPLPFNIEQQRATNRVEKDENLLFWTWEEACGEFAMITTLVVIKHFKSIVVATRQPFGFTLEIELRNRVRTGSAGHF